MPATVSAGRGIVTLKPVSKPKKTQTMKPSTAAQKLDVYLPATPPEFQEGVVSREELDALQQNPPQWLSDLRQNGPHPRSVITARLRVSNSGLARGGVMGPLTTVEIKALIADPPEWLVRERKNLAEVQREEQRLREQGEQGEQGEKNTKKPAPRRY